MTHNMTLEEWNAANQREFEVWKARTPRLTEDEARNILVGLSDILVGLSAARSRKALRRYLLMRGIWLVIDPALCPDWSPNVSIGFIGADGDFHRLKPRWADVFVDKT